MKSVAQSLRQDQEKRTSHDLRVTTILKSRPDVHSRGDGQKEPDKPLTIGTDLPAIPSVAILDHCKKVSFFILPSFIQSRIQEPTPHQQAQHPTASLNGMRGVAAFLVMICHNTYTHYDIDLPRCRLHHRLFKLTVSLSGSANTGKYQPHQAFGQHDRIPAQQNIWNTKPKKFLRSPQRLKPSI